jgi:membrane protein
MHSDVGRANAHSDPPDHASGVRSGARLFLGKLAHGASLAKELFKEMDKARTFGLAAETAFWLFLSLVPLAAVAGLLAAKLALANWQTVVPFFSELPPAARELVAKELGNVSAWGGGSVGITGVAVFIWLASSGIHSIFDSLELQTGSERPWWKKRLIALGTCVAFSIGVAVLTFIGPGIQAMERLVGVVPIGSSVLVQILRAVIGIGITFGMVSTLYWIGVPPRVRKQMPILPGAALAVSLQILLGIGYRIYLSTAGDGGAYQAGLAVIGVTLTALYLLSTALLAGAVLNRWIGCRRGTLESARPGTCSSSPEEKKREPENASS